MRAWHFNGTGKPFERVDIEEPTAGPGNVVIDVKAAGICHSDVGIQDDPSWMDLIPNTPVVPGHETAGVISEVGEGVTEWKVGDRVAVWPMEGPFGYGKNGGWEDRVEASASQLIPMPDGLSFELAAMATDAGMTAAGAIFDKGGVEAGKKVGVIGFGGLGQIGVQLAALEGAEVYVAELKEETWERAKEAGAKEVSKSILDFKDKELDVIIDFAGFGTTTAEAVEAVGFQGRVVIVGMGRLESTIDTKTMILKQVTLVGSNGASIDKIVKAMEFMAEGKLSPALEVIDFEEIAEGVARLRKHEVDGRLVAKVAD